MLLGCLAPLLVLLVVGGAVGYYAVRRDPMGALTWVAAQFDARLADQRTQRLVIDITLDPAASSVESTATLTMVSSAAGRRHYYFLLNPSFAITQAEVAGRTCRVARVSFVARITVPEAPAPGAPFDLTVRYAGTLDAAPGPMTTSYLDADGIFLNVGEFWYPSDIRGFFDADVTVRLPREMTVASTGDVQEETDDADERVVRLTWPRPVAGLGLIAGHFTRHSRNANGRRFDLYVPRDLRLPVESIFTAAIESEALYSEWFGASGYTHFTLTALPRVLRAFNEGSGGMGVPPRYLRGGDAGYGLIAHEMAHNWWGALVSERWLEAGTGGEWLVEGFAEMSALWALERKFGAAAVIRKSEQALFPPDVHRPLTELSALDNILGSDAARWTIYRKGSQVATLLRRTLGDDTFARVCAAFCETYRYQPVTDAQFAEVATAVSGRNLDIFFGRWVRDAALVDFAVRSADRPGAAVVDNLGGILPHRPVFVAVDGADGRAVYEVPPDRIGEPQPGVLADAEARLIADPPFAWPDMRRSNNVWPREFPLQFAVPAPADGRVLRVGGFPYAWEPHVVTIEDGHGATTARYAFERGVIGAPVWWPDGEHAIVAVATADADAAPELYWLDTRSATAGPEHIGVGSEPAVLNAAERTLLSAVDGHIMQHRVGGATDTHLAIPRWRLSAPRVAPDGTRVLATGTWEARSALWLWDPAQPDDARMVWETPRGRLDAHWLSDGARALVVQGRGDRHVLGVLAMDTGVMQDVVTDLALIGEVVVTPAGGVVFTGRKTLDFPYNGMSVYVIAAETGATAHVLRAPELRTETFVRPRWDAAANAIVCIRERAVPEFPARAWARRDLVHVQVDAP